MRYSILLLTMLFGLTLQAQRGNPEVAFEGQSVDAMIAAFMIEQDIPGLSLAIVQAPYVTRATGFGLGDKERRTLVASGTMFDIASMKNAFTAVAVMQLVEAGKLGIDDVRDLLGNAAEYPSLEKLVEKTSGLTYETFVRKGQFEPLALRHTFFGSELAHLEREVLAPGERHRRFLTKATLIDPSEPATGYRDAKGLRPEAGAIYSSASDISIWDIGLAGDILIRDPALRKILYQPPANGAWFFPGHEGLMIATGSGRGFSSLLSRFTKSDELICVTLLVNREGVDLTQLARRVAGAHNPRVGPPARARGMRVQQSPYGVEETRQRVEQAFRELALTTTPLIWEENREVWVASADPADSNVRRRIDDALLRAVSVIGHAP